MHLCL